MELLKNIDFLHSGFSWTRYMKNTTVLHLWGPLMGSYTRAGQKSSPMLFFIRLRPLSSEPSKPGFGPLRIAHEAPRSSRASKRLPEPLQSLSRAWQSLPEHSRASQALPKPPRTSLNIKPPHFDLKARACIVYKSIGWYLVFFLCSDLGIYQCTMTRLILVV